MKPTLHEQTLLDRDTLAFYGDTLDLLARSGTPFFVGGAFALARYTGIKRDTKDLDIFLRREDCGAALSLFERAGYHTDLPFPHWLAKVYRDERVVDLIFSSGNALVAVDEEWFANASEGTVLGRKVLMTPVEEMIWSKAFIMERERFDGADIAHLLRACGHALDWDRLLRRFGEHWRLLLAHLVLFGYVYPAEAAKVPDKVMHHLLARLHQESASPSVMRVCRGPLLSRSQYLIDLHEWGYKDARLAPEGKMSPREIAIWTAAIGIDNPALED